LISFYRHVNAHTQYCPDALMRDLLTTDALRLSALMFHFSSTGWANSITGQELSVCVFVCVLTSVAQILIAIRKISVIRHAQNWWNLTTNQTWVSLI